MDLKIRASSSDSDGENVDTSVKILINDITPCDSREFLHLPCSLLQCASQNDLSRSIGIRPSKGLLQRRASWSCTRALCLFQPKVVKKHSLAGIGKNARKEEWLMTSRSTLQKSVSTPSIVA